MSEPTEIEIRVSPGLSYVRRLIWPGREIDVDEYIRRQAIAKPGNGRKE